MGFLDKIFGGGKAKDTSADKMLQVIREGTTVDYVKVIPADQKPTQWNSKIGGMPYMPQGFVYPYDETVAPADLDKSKAVEQPQMPPSDVLLGGAGQPQVANPEVVLEDEGLKGQGVTEVAKQEKKPLRFLGQLNFSEIPALEGFPDEGILQFFISGDATYGLNFENRSDQKGFRVIYHEHVTEDAAALQSAMPTEGVEWSDSFPVEEEMKLRFEKASMPMTSWDFRFDKLLLEAYNETHVIPIPALDRVEENVFDKVYDKLESEGHRVGGYPAFTQLDPREYDEAFKEHTVLLFQLDSDPEHGISWGDSGVCNFFIRPEDLAKRDFSNVLYNWDCY